MYTTGYFYLCVILQSCDYALYFYQLTASLAGDLSIRVISPAVLFLVLECAVVEVFGKVIKKPLLQ